MKQDLYQAPDYFKMDELPEDILIRDAAREWVKRISPIIEEACQKAEFPKKISGLGEIGAFGPYIPQNMAGLD